MKRIVDWEKKLNETVQFHMDAPFQWGISDCYMLCDDVVKAITGKRIHTGVKYSSQLSGTKVMLKKGFEDFEDVFASKFDAIHPSQAKRGDIGIVRVENTFAGGVFTALGFMTKGEKTGIVFLPYSTAHNAFEV